MLEHDVEVAPAGTRALLREIAKVLRGYEEHHRKQAEGLLADLQDLPEVERIGSGLIEQANKRSAKADTNARLAGRIEAHLLGWEIEELTLDEAQGAFDAEPTPDNGHRLVAVARRYGRDEMIGDEEVRSIEAKVAESAK